MKHHLSGLVLLALVFCAAAAPDVLDVGRPECEERGRRKSTLKLIKETPFSGLFRDLKNSTVFEASGMARVRGKFYVVFDNSMSLGYLDDRFQFRDPENRLVGEWEPESQFEGIAYVPENDTFLLLHEAVETPGSVGTFKPYIRTVRLKKDLSGYDSLAHCEIDFELTHENKGFESIQYLHTDSGSYLLGLCEGNYCRGGARGREPGNGRIVVSQLKFGGDGGCVWEPVKTIKIPEGASFQDYSAMAYNYQTQKLAVLSQEDAAVWIGDFEVDALEFASEAGQIFHLPRDNHCDIVYCNAEGIQWIDNYRVVVASDKAKSRQPFWCDAKDQMIHLFSMPPTWDPYAPAAQAQAGRGGEGSAVAEL